MSNSSNANHEPERAPQDRDLEALLRSVTPVAPELGWEEMQARLQEPATTPADSSSSGVEQDRSMAGWSHAVTGLLGLAAGMLIMWAIQIGISADSTPSAEVGDQQVATERGETVESPRISEAPDDTSAKPLLTQQMPSTAEGGFNRSLAEEQVSRLSGRSARNFTDVGPLAAGNLLVTTRVETPSDWPPMDAAELRPGESRDRVPKPESIPPTPGRLMREILQAERVF